MGSWMICLASRFGTLSSQGARERGGEEGHSASFGKHSIRWWLLPWCSLTVVQMVSGGSAGGMGVAVADGS